MDVYVKNKVLYINMAGDIDHHSAAILREKSDEILNREYIKEIVFDFKDINFMDSSGIGLVMGRYRQAGYNNADVTLINVPESINRMFEMSGINKLPGIAN